MRNIGLSKIYRMKTIGIISILGSRGGFRHGGLIIVPPSFPTRARVDTFLAVAIFATTKLSFPARQWVLWA